MDSREAASGHPEVISEAAPALAHQALEPQGTVQSEPPREDSPAPSFAALGIERRTPTPVSVRPPIRQEPNAPRPSLHQRIAQQSPAQPDDEKSEDLQRAEAFQQVDLMLAELAAAQSPIVSTMSRTPVRLAVMGGGVLAMVVAGLGMMWLLGALLT